MAVQKSKVTRITAVILGLIRDWGNPNTRFSSGAGNSSLGLNRSILGQILSSSVLDPAASSCSEGIVTCLDVTRTRN